MTSWLEIVTSLSFFLVLANLELSGNRIPDAWTVKPYTLQTLKRELKNLQHSSGTIALSKGAIYAKKC